MEFDELVKDALRRKEPEPGFEDRLLARIRQEKGDVGEEPTSDRTRRDRRRRTRMIGLAAAITLALGGAGTIRGVRDYQERREGEQAKQQLMLALHIASRTTHEAFEQVRASTDVPRSPLR